MTPDSRNIVLTGFMGTGKSTVGPRVARRLGMQFVDMDPLIEERAGMRIAAIFEAQGEAALVHVARRGHGPVSIDVSDLPGIADSRVVKGGGGALETFTLTLTAAGPTVGIRIWQTPKPGARHNGQSAGAEDQGGRG